MILLDTDILTLLLAGHTKVKKHSEETNEEIAITVVTRIETLRGLFDCLLKAAGFAAPAGG